MQQAIALLKEQRDELNEVIARLEGEQKSGLTVDVIRSFRPPTSEPLNVPIKPNGHAVEKKATNYEKVGIEIKTCDRCGFQTAAGRGWASHRRSCGNLAGCEKHPDALKTRAGGCRRCDMTKYSNKYSRQRRSDNREDRIEEAVNTGAIPVPCPECGEQFESARSMGVHKTRTHFGQRSMTVSSLSAAGLVGA